MLDIISRILKPIVRRPARSTPREPSIPDSAVDSLPPVIGPDDWRNRKKWSEYEKAIDDMFERTDTGSAPWILIPANRKWFARTEVLKRVVEALEGWW